MPPIWRYHSFVSDRRIIDDIEDVLEVFSSRLPTRHWIPRSQPASDSLAGRGVALTHSDMRARNTFQNTDEVRPSSLPVKISNEGVVVTLPKQAVAAVEIRLE